MRKIQQKKVSAGKQLLRFRKNNIQFVKKLDIIFFCLKFFITFANETKNNNDGRFKSIKC